MKTLSSFIAITTLALASLTVQAEVVPVENWWLQTDSLGGLRQSTTNPDFYFAVSQSVDWSPTATYEAMAGYRVATTAEGLGVFNQSNTSGIHTYYNQGGWSGYNWEGLMRTMFRFADSVSTNAYKHAGNYDEYYVQYSSQTTSFAGLVMIKEHQQLSTNTSANVSTPIGLAALALTGLMLMRRRKA